ncbi:MAG: DUF4135 domain-containing protein, partial [Myxococcota bacterium]
MRRTPIGTLEAHDYLVEEVWEAFRQAATLWDRLGTTDRGPTDVGAARLQRWQGLVGGEAAWRRRITAAGWSEDAVVAALAAPGPPFPADPPGWVYALPLDPAGPRSADVEGSTSSAVAKQVSSASFDVMFGGVEGHLGARAAVGLRNALEEGLAWLIEPAVNQGQLSWSARNGGAAQFGGVANPAATLDFLAHMADSGWVGMLTRLPVLARLVGQFLHGWHGHVSELVTRLSDDRPALRDHLGIGVDEPILDVSWAMSDPHRGRRSVVRLQFASGAVYYKPRSMATAREWNWILEELRHCGMPFAPSALRIVDRSSHGYVEEVPTGEVAPAAIADWFRSAGALGALMTLFECTDVHFENLVAGSGSPYLIDTESAFSPRQDGTETTTSLLPALCRTGLLPSGNTPEENVSGLVARGDATSRNLPWSGGRTVSVLDWLEPLGDGFR